MKTAAEEEPSDTQSHRSKWAERGIPEFEEITLQKSLRYWN